MSQTDAQMIQVSIDQAKEMLELGNAVLRLRSHPDFQRLVMQGYFKDEAVRLVHLKSDAQMQTPEKQHVIDTDIYAIGSAASYFENILRRAQMARDAMVADEEALEEIRVEEAEAAGSEARSH